MSTACGQLINIACKQATASKDRPHSNFSQPSPPSSALHRAYHSSTSRIHSVLERTTLSGYIIYQNLKQDLAQQCNVNCCKQTRTSTGTADITYSRIPVYFIQHQKQNSTKEWHTLSQMCPVINTPSSHIITSSIIIKSSTNK